MILSVFGYDLITKLIDRPSNQLASSKELSVLFIGNSHTHTNNLPELVSTFASLNGDSLIFYMSAPSNYDFQHHTYLEETIEAIKSEDWDFVILQESGWKAAYDTDMANAMIYPFADTLMNIISIHVPDAVPVLFMTQAYKKGVLSLNDAEWCEIDPYVCNYSGMQDRVHITYNSLSTLIDADVSPVGTIWGLFQDQFPTIELFQDDGIHANEFGSYLSALVLYTTLFNNQVSMDNIDMNSSNYSIKYQIHKMVDETILNPNFIWNTVSFDSDKSNNLIALY